MKVEIKAEAETFEEMEAHLKAAIRTLKTRFDVGFSEETESVKYGSRLLTGAITMTISK